MIKLYHDQTQNKENKKESEFNLYKCFKIMILNLWSEDQEGPVKIHVYGGGSRECLIFINIACSLFTINSVCFVFSFSLRGSFRMAYCVPGGSIN